MFSYQYIDNLDPTEIKRMQDLYLKATSDPKFHFQYVDINATHFMGMEIEKTVLITVHPGYPLPMHIDQREGLALNIPLLNCEHTITELWQCDQPHKVGYTTNGIPYFYYSPDTIKTKIGEFVLTRPVLFDVRVPHSVTNNGRKSRLAISLRFKEDPWHLI